MYNKTIDIEMVPTGSKDQVYSNSLQKHVLPISNPKLLSCGVKSAIGNLSGSADSR